MTQPVLHRAHPTKRLPDASVVVPVDAPVDQREHLPTGAILPPLGVDGPDPHPAEETLRDRVSGGRPFSPVDPVSPNRSMSSSHPGRLW